MRSYALKREALRCGLISADEASASSEAFRLLAGQPALAALPAEPEQDADIESRMTLANARWPS